MRIWIRTGYEGLRLAACIGDKMQQEEEHDGAIVGAPPHVTADILSIKLCAKQG